MVEIVHFFVKCIIPHTHTHTNTNLGRRPSNMIELRAPVLQA